MDCMSTKFGVDSSSCFAFTAWTDLQTACTQTVTDKADHPTHTSAIAVCLY